MKKLELQLTIAEQDYNRLIEILDTNNLGYWLSPVLNKTDCSTALELLEQMLNKEQEFSIQVTNYSIRQSVNANINAIRSVMEMIKERQAEV